jgi:hypothetical protein
MSLNIQYHASEIYDDDYYKNHDRSFIMSASKCRYVSHPYSMDTTSMNTGIGRTKIG